MSDIDANAFSNLAVTEKPTSTMEQVTFRLPDSYIKQLQDEAKKHGEDRHHKAARRILIEKLTGKDDAELRAEVEGIRTELRKVHEAFANVAALLLSGVRMTEDEARTFVTEQILA